jgi:hypothetical protein
MVQIWVPLGSGPGCEFDPGQGPGPFPIRFHEATLLKNLLPRSPSLRKQDVIKYM